MTTYKVDGIGCEGCATAIRNAIGKAAPGAKVQVDVKTGLVAVEGPIDDATAREAIARAGYGVADTLSSPQG